MAKRDTIRLYRAEEKSATGKGVPDWMKQKPEYHQSVQASGRWFTDDIEEAEWYIEHEYPSGKIVVVDVPKEVASRYRVDRLKKGGGKIVGENPFAFSARPDKEYFLPREITKQARELTVRKDKRSSIESRVAIFIFFILSGLALSLSSLTSTGNAIGNLTGTSRGLLGILLFIAGLTGMVFNKRK